MYEQLLAYRNKYKSTCVPQRFDDGHLGRWVNKQRILYTNNKLSQDRTSQLNSIGFVWDPLNTQWNGMYVRLLQYKSKYQSTCVPQSYKAERKLALWVRTQRSNYRTKIHASLTTLRIKQLNSIGFVWNVQKDIHNLH